MKRKFDLYLTDIVEAIGRINEYTRNVDFETFVNTNMAVDAVLRNLEIIGEAASQIPREIKERHSNVPWREIQDFRIVVAHHYWKMNLERVWDIVKNKLPPLKEQIHAIVGKEKQN